MHFGFRRMRHIFRVMPKIYPGTVHHLSEASVNGLASTRSTGSSWRLDLAGCQERRYSSISKTKRPTSSNEFWSMLRSSLNQPRDSHTNVLLGPYWCWLNSYSSSKNLFKEEQVFLVLLGKYDDGSLGAKQNTIKMFEIAKALHQRYSFLQVVVVQHGKSMCLNNASKHFLQRIIKEYVTFPILLFNKQSISEVWMQKAPCVIISKGFSQNPMIYPGDDVDLKTLDEAIRDLKVKHDKGDNVNDAKSTWVKPIEVIKEPDVCFASRNLLFSFPGCISVEEGGDRLFLSDVNHHRIIVFDSHGKILDAIGSSPGFEDGEFETAKLMRPAASFYHASEDCLYFIDSENHAIRKADMERRVVETAFPLTGDSKRSKSVWNWILDKIWINRNIKPHSEEFNSDSFLFPWHLLRSSNDDTYVLDQSMISFHHTPYSFGTLWTIDLESGSVKEVLKEPSKIMEKCGQAILEKCAPLEHVPADWLQQRAHSTCSFEGISYAGLMSSVATCGDHIVLSDTDVDYRLLVFSEVGQTVVKFGSEAGLAMSFQFKNFGVLGLPYWIVSSLERVYSADDPYGDPDHSQCFRLLPGRVDITLNIDIPPHTELIERPQEGCIWRQARGSAIEISGVDDKAESSEKVGIAQQWYDEIDNLSFSMPQEESSTKEEIGRAGEEVQEGKVRIGCTINTSPGTSEAIIYAAVYLRLKKESNKQVNSRENKASRIADILDPKKKFKRYLLIEQLMLMSDRDLEELIFMRPLHVRLKFNCRDHPKSDQNTKGVVLTDSLVEVHVTL
ncbi:NHL domain-containing protein [Striga asiatica]|uniref:NHL domain-containing protein n=1 Tax=Striga asiatica TaxID=4170 RepID=A0A5A7REI2_STRAF|nr:NHL domain-containing protein [Striga asiatica]